MIFPRAVSFGEINKEQRQIHLFRYIYSETLDPKSIKKCLQRNLQRDIIDNGLLSEGVVCSLYGVLNGRKGGLP